MTPWLIGAVYLTGIPIFLVIGGFYGLTGEQAAGLAITWPGFFIWYPLDALYQVGKKLAEKKVK